MTKNRLLPALEELGLSGYEAQAYLAALSNPPATGYQLAKLSGVPRSRIYETIERLTAKGLLVSQPGDKNLLTALDYRTFLDQKERERTATIGFLREQLASLRAPVDAGIWTIEGRARILELAADLIRQAARYVYLSAAELDVPALVAAMEGRRARVQVHGVYCADEDLHAQGLVRHIGPSCARCCEIAVVVDSEQALTGTTAPEERASAALTRNPGLVSIAEQYIKHEIFINSLYAEKDAAGIHAYIRRYDRAMKKLP